MRRLLILVGAICFVVSNGSFAGEPADPPGTFFDAVMADGPLVYYTFDEESGTTAVDSSGNGHDGTYVGHVTHGRQNWRRGVTVHVDEGTDLDGQPAPARESYISVPGIPGASGLSQYTLEWIWSVDPEEVLEHSLAGFFFGPSMFSTDNSGVWPDAGGETNAGLRIATGMEGAAGANEFLLDSYAWLNMRTGGMVDGRWGDATSFGQGPDMGIGRQWHITLVVNGTDAPVVDGDTEVGENGAPASSLRWYINGSKDRRDFIDSGVVRGFGRRSTVEIPEALRSTLNLTAESQISNCTHCEATTQGATNAGPGGPAPADWDEFVIYDKALTDAQVIAHAEAAFYEGVEVIVDQDTGNVKLKGLDGFGLNDYAIISEAGTLAPANWSTFEDGGLDWSTDEATEYVLNESTNAGSRAIAFDEEIDLGNIWERGPFRDVRFFNESGIGARHINDAGIAEGVTYEGADIGLADIDLSGVTDMADWDAFVAASSDSLLGLTPIEAWKRGDLDVNFVRDLHDVNLFRDAYDEANGAGAFAQMIEGVPEPATLFLLATGALMLLRRRTKAIALVLAMALPLATPVPVYAGDAAGLLVHYDFETYDEADGFVENVANPGTYRGTDGDAIFGFDKYDLPISNFDGSAFFDALLGADPFNNAIVVDGFEIDHPNLFDGSQDWAIEWDFRTSGNLVTRNSGGDHGGRRFVTSGGALFTNGIGPTDAFVPAYRSEFDPSSDDYDGSVPADRVGTNYDGTYAPAWGLGPDDGSGIGDPTLPPETGIRATDNFRVYLSNVDEEICTADECRRGTWHGLNPTDNADETITVLRAGGPGATYGWKYPRLGNPAATEQDSPSGAGNGVGRWWNESIPKDPMDRGLTWFDTGGARTDRMNPDAAGTGRGMGNFGDFSTTPRDNLVDTDLWLFDDEWHNLLLVYEAPKVDNDGNPCPDNDCVNNEAATAAEAAANPHGTFYWRHDGLWTTKKKELGSQQLERDADGLPVPRISVFGQPIDSRTIGPGGDNSYKGFEGDMRDLKIWGSGRVPTEFRATANRDTGEVTFIAGEFGRQLASIELLSADGQINPDAWNSLADQGIEGVDSLGRDEPLPGTPWAELEGSRSRLAEAVLVGTTYFVDDAAAAGGDTITELSIGNVFDPSTDVPGDYNDDNEVNAPDYNVWRDSFGQVGEGLPADGNGDNEINAPDYNVWRDNFGRVAGLEPDLVLRIGVEVPNLIPAEGYGGYGPSDFYVFDIPIEYIGGGGSSGAVPEPSALALVMLSLLFAVGRRRPRLAGEV